MFVCEEHFNLPEEWKTRLPQSVGPCESCTDGKSKVCYDAPTSLWWELIGKYKYPDVEGGRTEQ